MNVHLSLLKNEMSNIVSVDCIKCVRDRDRHNAKHVQYPPLDSILSYPAYLTTRKAAPIAIGMSATSCISANIVSTK